MKIPVLTGISKESIDDLMRHRIRTFDIRSTHNLIIFSEIKVGEKIFITDVVPPDLVPGLCGYIATVNGIDIRMHRTTYTTPINIEERETMAGRIQLIMHSRGKIRDVQSIENYKPIYVDAIEVTICDAR